MNIDDQMSLTEVIISNSIRYDLDIGNFYHPIFLKRNHSPPEPSFSETSLVLANPLPFIQNSCWTNQDGYYGFIAESEANTVTDEIAAKSSLRECE